jgi:nucleoid-associated protein YgaU
MVALFAAIVVAGGTALVFAVQHNRREPAVDAKAATSTPAAPQPSPALATAQAEASAVATALTGSRGRPDSGDGVPAFDIARIEPTGEAVIAGHAAPGATVELLRNGVVHDRAVADQAGQFAMVPSPLPAGTYDLTLRAKQPDGKQVTSKQSVAVVLLPRATERPVVALMTPDKPTVVLSVPAAQRPVAGTVVVESVEIGPDGKFHLSGHARAGAAVRFYLNDSFVAPITAGADGRLSVTINEGVAPGSYRVRLDEVEKNSGAVRARAEVPFNVPDTTTASVPAQSATPKRTEIAAAQATPQLPGPVQTAQPGGSSPSAVVVPKISTTTVSRGDSLWRISHTTYGAGMRYAIIYKANEAQIRNPNRIYPGQIFVLPAQ